MNALHAVSAQSVNPFRRSKRAVIPITTLIGLTSVSAAAQNVSVRFVWKRYRISVLTAKNEAAKNVFPNTARKENA